jgi:hypothetical protein
MSAELCEILQCDTVTMSGHVQEEGEGQEQGGQQAGLLRLHDAEAAASQGHPGQHLPHRCRGLHTHHIPRTYLSP